MLTTAEINEELAHVSYKPGWRFTVYDGEFEGQHAVITTRCPDARNPTQTTTLDVHSSLPPIPTSDYLHRWLAWRLGIIELHEMREFLQRDGTPIFDPHAPLAERDNPNYAPESG